MAALPFLQRFSAILIKNNRLVIVHHGLALYVQLHRPGQYDFFQVAAFSDQIGDMVGVGYGGDILGDDRALVEVFGDVMAGRSDNLDPSLEGGVVGLGAGERG